MSVQKGAGFLDYIEDKKKGHKVITAFYRHDQKDYVPQYKLKRTKPKVSGEGGDQKGGEAQGEYPKI